MLRRRIYGAPGTWSWQCLTCRTYLIWTAYLKTGHDKTAHTYICQIGSTYHFISATTASSGVGVGMYTTPSNHNSETMVESEPKFPGAIQIDRGPHLGGVWGGSTANRPGVRTRLTYQERWWKVFYIAFTGPGRICKPCPKRSVTRGVPTWPYMYVYIFGCCFCYLHLRWLQFQSNGRNKSNGMSPHIWCSCCSCITVSNNTVSQHGVLFS